MSSKAVSAKKATTASKIIECIGYITPINNPDVITSVVLQDKNTGVKFSASMVEALQMANEGHLVLPPHCIVTNEAI